jgi:hypothetical protein
MGPHRALGIAEVLTLVFEELHMHNKKRSLARSAQACKSFSEPALAILWRNLDSLSPMVKLIPSLRIAGSGPVSYV